MVKAFKIKFFIKTFNKEFEQPLCALNQLGGPDS